MRQNDARRLVVTVVHLGGRGGNHTPSDEVRTSVQSGVDVVVTSVPGKMSKRRRTSSVASRQEEETDTDSTPEPSRKRKKLDPAELCQQVYDVIRSHKKEDGALLCDSFIRAPKRRQEPGYYEVVSNPIDLLKVQQKLKTDEYEDIDELSSDIQLMVNNTKAFYKRTSQEYKDACELWELFVGTKSRLLDSLEEASESKGKIILKVGKLARRAAAAAEARKQDVESLAEGENSESSSITLDEDMNQYEELFTAVMMATDPDNRSLHTVFQLLPSKKRYPEYYEVIENPVDLKMIATKIQQNKYTTLSEMEKDLLQMTKNACLFNEPGSQIYKDAKALKKIITSKKIEVEHGKFVPGKTSERISEPFWKLPSKRYYPDYFKEIKNPVSLFQIKKKLKRGDYGTVSEVAGDMNIMFENAKKYNRADSKLYKHEDGRQPILMFMEKPSKKLYPDYFQVITDPIDMLTIQSNITAEKYNSEEEIVNDFKLMFNNCRLYNEEGSMIYEDANKLEQAQKLRTLYDTIRDYRDPKVRQLSLIFQKLPSKNEYPDYYEVIKRPIDLERIGQKLKSNQYESLEDMVSDFVLMFDNACKYNEPDSQIYKDALMLQRVALQTKLQLREDEEAVPDVNAAVQELLTSLFISIYNHQDEEGRCFSDSMAELPEHDEVDGRKVRALSFDLIKRRLDRGLYRRLDIFQEDVFACLERARRLSRTDSQVFEDSIELQSYFIKQRDELCRGGDLLHSPALNFSLLHLAATEASGESMSFNQQVYHVSDFVYAEPKERGMEPSIIHIERLWNNQEGQQMMYGNVFFRPNETYHVTTRKFLEKEVFKSDIHKATPLEQVLGKCCVLHVKDYVCSKPEGFLEKDVYVCESRYSSRARAFKKIKVWPFAMTQNLKLLERDEVIEPKRIMSVFRERIEKHKEEIAELEEREKFLEKEKPQYNAPACLIRSGDCVYVKNGSGRQLIAQVDTIWTTKVGVCYFRGPWLVTPPEIPHAPTRLFYKQEVFLSLLEDTHSVDSIAGKCAVLEHAEYISCRPTEIPESDVYVCESMYDEAKQQVKKLMREGLKKYSHSNAVSEDEIYFFRRLINPPKKQLSKKVVTGYILYSGDVRRTVAAKHPESSFGDISRIVGNEKQIGKKLLTGYILYCSEVRRSVTANHSESTFGEISRIIGNQWRNLPAQEKQSWEEKAAKVFECCWDNCDFQFEDIIDCYDHAAQEPHGHKQSTSANGAVVDV
uniref:Protein polybromo-1 n=1 Tax=Timema poppense TaxID=170557 RepID=A0A7R9GZT9_TIMPO|nr:unnamed protein product [Timema poppensis]